MKYLIVNPGDTGGFSQNLKLTWQGRICWMEL